MITDTMYIGSGDITALLSDIHSSSYAKLLQRFVSGEKPHYNALASPIDALRTGAILEDVYGKTLPFCYVSQYKVQSIEMDVFKASLDFAEIDDGKLKAFIELKTVSFDEYFDKIVPLESNSENWPMSGNTRNIITTKCKNNSIVQVSTKPPSHSYVFSNTTTKKIGTVKSKTMKSHG